MSMLSLYSRHRVGFKCFFCSPLEIRNLLRAEEECVGDQAMTAILVQESTKSKLCSIRINYTGTKVSRYQIKFQALCPELLWLPHEVRCT